MADADDRTPDPSRRDARHRARAAALQMLYQWEVGRAPISEVRQTFWQHEADLVPTLTDAGRAFANSLAAGVSARVDELDPLISEAAARWRLERMNVMDRLILRLAVYEFLHEPETPGSVVINEALELARAFSADEAVAFINGVLDAIRRKLERS